MQSKLTLSIEQEVIDQAKAYAKGQGISLSKLVQDFLKRKAKHIPQESDVEIPDKLKALVGVINLSDDFDLKKEKAGYLIDKYKRLG